MNISPMRKTVKKQKRTWGKSPSGKSSVLKPRREIIESFKEFANDIAFGKSIIHNSPDITAVIEKGGIISFVSPSISRIHGLRPELFIGRSFSDLVQSRDLPKISGAYRKVLKTNRLIDFGGLSFNLKKGLTMNICLSAKRIKDSSGKMHVIAYFKDNTKMIEAEKALMESEARYKVLAENARDMMFIVNRKGIIEYVNKCSADQFKIPPSRMIGKPLKDFFPSYIHKRMWGSIQKVFKSGKPLYVANDTLFPQAMLNLDTWLVPIKDESGRIQSVFGLSRDMTIHRIADEALKLKSAEAEAANARSQIYFDYMAHDIANLISPILTYSDTMQEMDDLPEEAKNYLTKISELVQQTARLILNLRMLVEAEKVRPEEAGRFDLRQFFKEVESSTKAGRHGKFKVHLSLPSDQKIEVLGGTHIRNAMMQGFLFNSMLYDNPDLLVNIRVVPLKIKSRPYWQIRMEMPSIATFKYWDQSTSDPFDPAKRVGGKSTNTLSFLTSIIRHFGGEIKDELMVRNDPTKGHVLVIELPKAGSWHTTRNT